MKVDEKLVNAAIEYVKSRDAKEVTGAAAMYLEGGQILVSTSPAWVNESVAVCHEMGAFCEAYRLNKKILATACVSREKDGFYILSPCGVCQERLWLYGENVECAVPDSGDYTKWKSIKLSVLSPHYWRKPFIDE
jgi:cytidine deaminase